MFMRIGGCTGGGAAGAEATDGTVGGGAAGAAVGGDGEGALAATCTGAGGGGALAGGAGSFVAGIGASALATAGRRRTDSRPSKKNTVPSKATNAVAAAINTGRVTCIPAGERAAGNCQ
jgi:hypothetical protein